MPDTAFQVPSLVRELKEILEPTWPMFNTSGLVAEAQPDEEEGTPDETPGTPAEGTSEEEVNWAEEGPRFKQRYEDLRPHADRSQSRLDSFEQRLQSGDPEAVASLLAEYGWELPQAEPQEEPDEFQDPVDQRLSQVEQMLAERQTAEQQAAFEEAEVGFINEQLEQIDGPELSEEAIQVIGDLSRTNRDEQGYPDVKGAYEHVTKILEDQKKAYAQGKRQAPLPPEGIPGSEKVNLKDDRSRQAAMARVMEASDDSG